MKSKSSSRHSSGFGLIEVMVAILVLSIGFLGLAGMVVRSLSTNGTAMARSVATVAAYSIQDAMRADRTNAANGSYNGTVTASSCSIGTGSVAQLQLGQWCAELSNPVLNGATAATGVVQCTNIGMNSVCMVTISWDDSRNGTVSGSTTQTVTTVGML
ncbi:MAG: type IV pilus modification protein PilV [Betaproteobacteria bacterium]|nr:type IV pilus modification protein PilV [Betaproteobacteria bacterium]